MKRGHKKILSQQSKITPLINKAIRRFYRWKRLKQKSVETKDKNYLYFAQQKKVQYRNKVYDCHFIFHLTKEHSFAEIKILVPQMPAIQEQIAIFPEAGFESFETQLKELFDAKIVTFISHQNFHEEFRKKDSLCLDKQPNILTKESSQSIKNIVNEGQNLSDVKGAFLQTEEDFKHAEKNFEILKNRLNDLKGAVEQVGEKQSRPQSSKNANVKFTTYDGVEKRPDDIFWQIYESANSSIINLVKADKVTKNSGYGKDFFCFRFDSESKAHNFVQVSNKLAAAGYGQPWRFAHAMIHEGFSQEDAKRAVEKFIEIALRWIS